MITVKEVSRRTGVSIRTLHYYDKIGLLRACAYTDSGYRLYDDSALERLQQILLFRELEFPLKEIQRILNSPDYDRDKALMQQIQLLELKKAHIDDLIAFAHRLKLVGGKYMDFSAFDSQKLDTYAKQARETWGQSTAYQEYEEKNAARTSQAEDALAIGLMAIFAEMGQIKQQPPDSPQAQSLVEKLQSYITTHYYCCTRQILLGLGRMYAAGGEFTENIDAVGGSGTADFADAAIRFYCTG